ncbi:MAG: lipoprotein-releasing system ATP-binding protein LolD [Flavobacteriaceae bacterium]|nr:lipoprotein-releasing system ATP-binding protein LolD [Flavobacteriaceae bacterium]
MLKACNINKTINNKKILTNVNLSINEGEIVSVVGPSGAGKTTLINILSTLSKPDITNDCSIYIDNYDILNSTNNNLSKFRNEKIGFIFQFHELLPEFTSIENIILPNLIKGFTKIESYENAKNLLDKIGLKDKENLYPNQLSGGEKQRVAVARALINKPKIVFADEPTGNLDSKNANQLNNLFFELRKKFNNTFVIVTHNEEFANKSDRKIKLIDGILSI